MKKILATCGLVLACGFGANAMAQNANVSTTTTASATVSQQNTNADENANVAVGTRPVPAPGDRNCIRDTGSHIPPKKGECLPVAGSSYSHEDIQRTGQTDVARALQQLDPAVQISGRGH